MSMISRPAAMLLLLRPVRPRLVGVLLLAAWCLAALAAGSSAHAASFESRTLGEQRPYDVLSAWNVPIGSNPRLSSGSLGFVAAVTDNNLPLTSDVDQYAIPVYYFDDQTPRRTVHLGGYYSTYDAGDDSRVGYGFAPTITDVPIPDSALASAGSDGQIVLWNPQSGVVYTFWQFAKDSGGEYVAENGNRHHTTAGYYGRFADGLAGRGAGTPYLAGLVRPWEIAQGHIDHALAFAYDSPAPSFVYPASKSDGGGVLGTDIPEGARLQLDPDLDDADFNRWGLSSTAKVIARALQRYGMYVIDHGGSSKIFLEDRITAGWPASIDRDLPAKIPLSRFRVVVGPPSPSGQSSGCGPPTAAGAPKQATQTRSALRRLAKAMRALTAHRMRLRPGPLLSLPMRSGSAVRIRVSGRVGGRKRILATARAEAECGRAKFRLRPTLMGRRQLHRGRRVAVELRFRAYGSAKTTSRSRALRLRH